MIRLIHTEVPPAFSGQGHAFDARPLGARRRPLTRLTVRPDCPYVESYIKKHPEYADLVAAWP